MEDKVVARPNNHLGIDDAEAQVLLAELKRLEESAGGLRPQTVVDAARDPASPFHRHFKWDVEYAANQHWLSTARKLIGVVKIVATNVRGDEVPVRAMASIRCANTDGDDDGYEEAPPTYVSVRSVMTDDEKRQIALESLVKRLCCYRDEASMFEECERAGLLRALDKLNTMVFVTPQPKLK